MPTRLLVVEDNEAMATSLVWVLGAEPDLEVSGVAPDLAAARRLLAGSRPDVVLLDHRLPDGDGIAAISELREVHDAAFVVLSASVSDQVLVAAVEAGATGYVSKTSGLPTLVDAVHAAASGEAVIAPGVLSRVLRLLAPDPGAAPAGPLTPPETAVLGMMASGLTDAEMAEELGVGVPTVRDRVAEVAARLDASSRLDAVFRGVRRGLVDIEGSADPVRRPGSSSGSSQRRAGSTVESPTRPGQDPS